MSQGSEAADAAIARLKVILDAAEAEVRRLLLRMQTAPNTSTIERVQNNMAVSSQIRRRIVELGDVVAKDAAQAAATSAMTEARRLGVSLDPQTARLLDAITQDRIREISQVWGDAAEEVARAARVATTSGADLSRLVDNVQAKMGGARAASLSAVDSMAMAAGRQITILDAEASGEAMIYGYGGPIDRITRAFCREHATSTTKQVYTRQALDRLTNPGQPGPVSVYLGGYNCRHNLQPMTREQAKEKGLEVVE